MYLLATPPPACLCVLGHRNHSLQGVRVVDATDHVVAPEKPFAA